MIGWRLVQAQFIDSVFSGEGATRNDGRWNRPGTPVIYACENLSLSAFEVLVHLGGRMPKAIYKAVSFEFPDSVKLIEYKVEDLPADWRRIPPPNSTKEIGENWVKENKVAIIKVPSVIVPVEFNLIINPNHKDFRLIKEGKSQDFYFDRRIWGETPKKR